MIQNITRLAFRLLVVANTLLLSACVSQYSISEREMEQYLNKEIHFEAKQGNGPIGAEIRLNDIDVTLGAKPDTMAVSASTRVTLRTPIFPLSASLKANFEAKPWYDKTNHSVYLRELQLVSVESEPKDIERALSSITPQVMSFITRFLETQPVYVLDTKDSNQALMAKMTERIEVKPGKLILNFKEDTK